MIDKTRQTLVGRKKESTIILVGGGIGLSLVVIYNWLGGEIGSVDASIGLLGSIVAGGLAHNNSIDPKRVGFGAAIISSLPGIAVGVQILPASESNFVLAAAVFATFFMLLISGLLGVLFGLIGHWITGKMFIWPASSPS